MTESQTCPDCDGYAEQARVRHVTRLRPPRSVINRATLRIDVEAERLARLGWAVDEIGVEFGLSNDEVAEAVGFGRIARYRRTTARSVGYAYMRRVAKEMDDDDAASDE